MNHQHEHRTAPKSFWKNPFVIIALVGIGYWVYTYHREHALGFLPYAILLLCPLMHIFMHGGHGGHGGGGHGNHEKHEGGSENQEVSSGKAQHSNHKKHHHAYPT